MDRRKRYELISKWKEETEDKHVTMGCPEQLKLFYDYSRRLGFKDRPDYGYLRGLLWDIIF